MPEFISLLRWVRDTAYPQFQTWLTGAESARDNSLDRKLEAKSYATEDEDTFVKSYTDEVASDTTDYSSKHYSIKSSDSAALASASEDAALISETNAEDSAVASAASAVASSNHASTSLGHANNALSYASDSQLKAWESEAEKMTSDSYANEAHLEPVKIYTSNGDGTFTATDTSPAEYSSLHYSVEAGNNAEIGAANSLSDVDANNPVDGDLLMHDGSNYVNKQIPNQDTAKFTIADMISAQITNTINKNHSDIVLYKGQTVTDGDGETLVFNAQVDILPYKGTFWNGSGSTITVVYYIDSSETTTANIDVLNQTSFVNLGVGSIDFTQVSNGTGYYHDRSNASGIGGDCIIVNDAGDTRFVGAMALPEDKFIVKVNIKARSATYSHNSYNGLRGALKALYSDTNAAETAQTTTLEAFTNTGVTLGDSSNNYGVNQSGNNYRLEYKVYTHIVAGDTEQGQPFIYAWNPKTGDVTGVFNGSGQVGHRVPMPFKLDFGVFKNTETTNDGRVYFGNKDKFLEICSSTGSVAEASGTDWNNEEPTDEYITLGNTNAVNALNNTIYFEGKQNSFVNKTGTCIGNGGYNEIKDEDGNVLLALNTGDGSTNTLGREYFYNATLNNGKLVSVTIKCISDGTTSWVTQDYSRGDTKELLLETNGAEYTYSRFANPNLATSGAIFDWNSDTTQLVLTDANFRYTEGLDDKGYILSRELVNGSIDLTGVSDGEKWVGREKATGYTIYDNKPIFKSSYDKEFADDNRVVMVNGVLYSTADANAFKDSFIDLSAWTTGGTTSPNIDSERCLLTSGTIDGFIEIVHTASAGEVIKVDFAWNTGTLVVSDGVKSESFTGNGTFEFEAVTDNPTVTFAATATGYLDLVEIYKKESTLDAPLPNYTSFLKKSVLVVDEKPVSFGDEELVENVMESLQCTRIEAEEFIGNNATNGLAVFDGSNGKTSFKNEGIRAIQKTGTGHYRVHTNFKINSKSLHFDGTGYEGSVGALSGDGDSIHKARIQEINDYYVDVRFIYTNHTASNAVDFYRCSIVLIGGR